MSALGIWRAMMQHAACAAVEKSLKTKVSFSNVSMTFKRDGKEVNVLDHINLEAREGEFLCILGPSGCGKSTLLNIVGGFLPQSSGDVTIDGEAVTGPDPRRIFVFQERGVFPWLTVEGNIGFGLFKLSNEDKAKRIAHYVKLVGLTGFEHAYPQELSGGMKQRLEVARALAVNPDMLFLDEPFGAFGSITRLILSHTKVCAGPMDVQRGLMELTRKGLLWNCIRDSLFRVGSGYSLAILFGIPTGLVLGWYPSSATAVNPLIQILRPISPLAWIPLSIVWFGIGNEAAIFLICLASFFPVVVSTVNLVPIVPPMFRNAGRNFGLSPTELLRRVVFPAALPQVLVGLRIALGIAWLVVVAAEMIAVDSGRGYLVSDSGNAGKRYDLVVAGMLLIGLIGLGLDIGIRRMERWK